MGSEMKSALMAPLLDCSFRSVLVRIIVVVGIITVVIICPKVTCVFH
jgi:hypothetical protein